MTLTLELNSEQEAALAAVVAEHNASNPNDAPLTNEQYLQRGLVAQVASYTSAAFDASVKRLADAAAALPYEQRLVIISAVESQLPKA